MVFSSKIKKFKKTSNSHFSSSLTEKGITLLQHFLTRARILLTASFSLLNHRNFIYEERENCSNSRGKTQNRTEQKKPHPHFLL